MKKIRVFRRRIVNTNTEFKQKFSYRMQVILTHKPQQCSYELVDIYTDGFSNDNLIGKFQFGKVFRGVTYPPPAIDVIVKIWDSPENHTNYNEFRLRDEILLLTHEEFKFHPALVTMYGYCYEDDTLAVAYAIKPIDTLHNLVPKDNFTWQWRVKVALRFACLLEFLHGHNPMGVSIFIRNISAAHIILDEDYNPQLFDFGLITGGIVPDRTMTSDDYQCGCYGYVDPNYGFEGGWSVKSDVFAFGVLLLMLITKRVYNEEENGLEGGGGFIYQWAQNQYRSRKSSMVFGKPSFSLVHHSLEADPHFVSSDGHRITKLAMRCVELDPSKRPTMERVVRYLLSLRFVPHHAEALGVKRKFYGYQVEL